MDDLRAGPVTIPADELKIRFTRSGGPGGQNVNKRSTRVEVSYPIATSRALTNRQRILALERLGSRIDARGRIHVVSSSGRTQAENRVLALARLQGLVADAVRPPPRARRATKPTRSAVDKRIKQKKLRSDVKRKRQKPGLDHD